MHTHEHHPISNVSLTRLGSASLHSLLLTAVSPKLKTYISPSPSHSHSSRSPTPTFPSRFDNDYSSFTYASFAHHSALMLSFLFAAFIVLSCYSLSLNAASKEEPVQSASSSQQSQPQSQHKIVGISQIVEHPALDAVRTSMLESLKDNGYEEGKNLTVIYENAQGNIGTSSQIATKLLSSNMDVGVAISTPSAQTLFYTAQKQGSHIPIVFTAVTDPVAAKLISDTYPITGVTDEPHLEGLMEIMNKMLPNLKTLGLMYNPAEANSVSTIARLKKMLDARGIQAVEVTVNKSSDVAQAMQSIVGKVDALYFPQDNTMVSAIETVASVAQHSSPTLPVILPIFTSDTTLIKRGILAAVGFDYIDIGKTTGQVVAQILNGKEARSIAIQTPKNLKAVVNKTLAKKLGLPIPTDLKYSKVQVIE